MEPEAARILLADDDQAVLDAIQHALERERFEIETVGDGETALERARRGDFDVVILNVMMPRLFGTDVCRTLRAESDVPIILLSARDGELDRVLGLELGAELEPKHTVELTVTRAQQDDRHVALGSQRAADVRPEQPRHHQDRKSTRLNSSHGSISYAVFCLKKKNTRSAFPSDVKQTLQST